MEYCLECDAQEEEISSSSCINPQGHRVVMVKTRSRKEEKRERLITNKARQAVLSQLIEQRHLA